jgi:hypothetical protein
VGTELRPLHLADELETDPDEGRRAQWEELQLFSKVQFEDMGVRGSILDRTTPGSTRSA